MENRPKDASRDKARKRAAKIFYFCYRLLDDDRICAERAARCALIQLLAHGAEEPEEEVAMRGAALAWEACRKERRISVARAEYLLWHIFRLDTAHIAQITGRSAEEAARSCRMWEPADDGIPLLPLLEGECLATCPYDAGRDAARAANPACGIRACHAGQNPIH